MSDEFDKQRAFDVAMQEAIGMHGAWVLAVEVYDDETGEPRLLTYTSMEGTPWAKAGMVAVLAEHVDSMIGVTGDDD